MKRAFCAFCHDRIWGLGRQGFKCIQCKLLVHKKCHKLVQKPCSNELVEPIHKEREVSWMTISTVQSTGEGIIIEYILQHYFQDLNGEATNDVHHHQATISYPQEIPEQIDHIAVEAATSNEELLEPGAQRQYSLIDFELIRVIGRGSYAKVLMVELKKTRRIYAMKVIKKALVTDDEDIDWVQTEKHVFETASNHPFLVGLHSCFQTPSRYVKQMFTNYNFSSMSSNLAFIVCCGVNLLCYFCQRTFVMALL